MHYLDTSAALEVLHGTEKGKEIQELIGKGSVSTSSFTIHELFVGLKTNEQEVIQAFFNEIVVWDFDSIAAMHSSTTERILRKKGTLINVTDIFIAGIAQAHNLHLISCDKDFKRVPGLKVSLF